jgi:hypothetical protein
VGSDGSTWRNFSGATDQYNFGPTNHYLRPADRYTLGASGHYELNDKADVYTQLMFTDYRSIAQIAPGGIFIGDTSTINCDNPFIPAANRAAIGCTAAKIAAKESVPMYIGRRNTEGGGRQQSFTNQSYRAVVGVRGDINDAWGYDFAAQRSTLKADQQTLNYFVIDRIKNALDVVLVNGVPTCRSVVNGTDANCKPYNAFKTGGVTQDALNYLQAPGLQTGTIDQEVYTLTFTGDLNSYGVKMPAAEEGAQVAFGAEYRRDSLENTTDALLTSAALSGTGGPTIGLKGATQVKDLFLEGRLPLVQGKTFAESLSLDVAYRYSDYGKVNTDTYKLGLEWAPVEDFRVRGSFQRAVRAANIIELFTAQGNGLFDLDGDPCGEALGTTVSGVKATAVWPPACRQPTLARRRSTARPVSTSCWVAVTRTSTPRSRTRSRRASSSPRRLCRASWRRSTTSTSRSTRLWVRSVRSTPLRPATTTTTRPLAVASSAMRSVSCGWVRASSRTSTSTSVRSPPRVWM